MDEVCGFALEALWDTVTAGNAVWAGAAIGQKVGKLASGYLFGTDAIVKAWYTMEAGESLDLEAVREAMEYAPGFFKTYFDSTFRLFHCHSWLRIPLTILRKHPCKEK